MQRRQRKKSRPRIGRNGGRARCINGCYDPRAMAKHKPIRKIYSPMVWPTWLIVGCAWLVARLPLGAIFALGLGLGKLFYRFGGSRSRITEINIERCFGELSVSAREELVRSNLIQVATGILEMTIPWLNPGRDLSDRFDVHGVEHLQKACAQGRGVVLVGAHFAAMDIILQPLSKAGPIDLMYRFNKNPVWEWLQVRGRRHFFSGVIEREDTRQILKRLKQGRAIWYAADQDYGRKHSVLVPFFGIEAATIVATSRFAKLNGSAVVFLRQTRDIKARRWSLNFRPAPDGFPTGDDVTDATLMNTLIESEIRLHPDQYLWLHRRFKTRPEGDAPFYD
jgi:KDO2-lipid IV(A) lauroyltransferase